jgi:hypothetical protein
MTISGSQLAVLPVPWEPIVRMCGLVPETRRDIRDHYLDYLAPSWVEFALSHITGPPEIDGCGFLMD